MGMKTYKNYDKIINDVNASLENIAPQVAANTTAISNIGNASPKGVYATVPLLTAAFPAGNTNIYLVTGSVAEVANLVITAPCTASGNVTVTLNGVAVNVAVLTSDTAIQVATKIRAATFVGWTTGGTAGTTTVTFTCNNTGTKTDAVFAVASTGVTGTMTTTTQGVAADGNWYYWNGSAWTPGGAYQAGLIADKSVTLTKLAVCKNGKNLFNKAAANIGFYVEHTTGVVTANVSYDASNYISVLPDTQYCIAVTGGSTRICYYNINKAYISGLQNPTSPVTTPAGTAYVIFSFIVASLDVQQFEQSAVKTTFEAYKEIIPKENLEDKPFDVSSIPNGSLPYKSTNYITTGKNLFDKNAETVGYYVNYSTGVLFTSATYSVSDYIPVLPSTVYIRTADRQMAFYDSNKTYISGLSSYLALGVPFTTPSNAAYCRLSVYDTEKDIYQFELGNVQTAFEAFGYKIPKLIIQPSTVDLTLFLPSEICIAAGRTIEIYNKQIAWCGNIDNYHFKYVCDVGKCLKRKWSCTGITGNIGTHAMTVTVYDNNMQFVATASTNIKIVSATISTARSILTIGDSLSNNKPWMGELRTLSGNQYSLVGTRGTSPLKHEGRSGWTATTYLTGASYTYESEGVNPFWNPSTSQFDYAYYIANNAINPDAIQLYLGTNGIALDPTTNAGSIKSIVDGIRSVNATIPIFVVFTLYRGGQNGIGNQSSGDGYIAGPSQWKLEEDRKVYNLMVAVNSLLSSYTNLYFVPIALTHDSEYNFITADTVAVNPRAIQTEPVESQATHPQNQGYYQMADIMFSTFAAH